MPEADDNTSAPPPGERAADPAGPPADLARPPVDTARPPADMVGPAEDVAEPDAAGPAEGAAPCGGLAWSWGMDFDALLAALSEPAPWNVPVRPAPAPVAAAPVRPAPVSPVPPPAAGEPAAPVVSDSAAAGVDPVEAEFAGLLEAVEAGRSQVVPLAVVAGRVAESLPAGPDLAGWLATSPVAGLEDGALAGMAASYRRLASWAQAGELAVVAQLAARSAAADTNIGTGTDGRPARLPDEACAQVSLALTMSQAAASWWSELAVTLTWRLPATGAALRGGQIDLGRARLIAEATAALDEDKARAVEAKVLPRAGDQTTGQLRAALRRAVITADPQGAERRREEAERQARVSLYPDPDGTASLAGYRLPAVLAAAAMARISALAQAVKATGAGGGIDRLRAHVFLGLLLGTLPYIPPAEGGPPDVPPGEPGDQPDEPPDDHPGAPAAGKPRPGDLAPADPPASSRGPGSSASGRDRSPRPAARGDAPGGRGTGGQGTGGQGTGSPGTGSPGTGDQGTGGQGTGGQGTGGQGTGGQGTGGPGQPGNRRSSPARPGTDDSGPAPPGTGNRGPDDPPPGPEPEPPRTDTAPPGPEPEPPRTDPPPPGPAPPDDDDLEPDWLPPGSSRADPAEGGDWLAGPGPPPAWPPVPPVLPPGPAAMANLRPAGGGLLDLTVPWSTLTGQTGEPGQLTRIGPITPVQARHLAGLAAADPGVSWRVILTGPDGRAVAACRVPKRRQAPKVRAVPCGSGGRECPPEPGSGDRAGAGNSPASLIRRVTVTIAADHTTGPPPAGLPVILEQARRVAAQAAEHARLQAIADTAAGGCAHDLASPAYAAPPRLRDFITARDGTCRFPTCRQPVWRCDLDHSIPYHKGGKTCSCNLGGLCRFHHVIKQHNRWQLAHAVPGTFAWTTPAGRTYHAQPDQHAA
jgi:Domain of unknown function (DUF222)